MKTVIDMVNELQGEWHKSKDQLYACDKGVITNYDNFMLAVAECETNFGKCEQSYSDYKSEYHYGYSNQRLIDIQIAMSKPPVYTQEMVANGVLPSMGMDCLSKKSHQDDSYFNKSYINGYSRDGKWLIFTDYLGNIESHNISNGVYDFKPLTVGDKA
jgi:hypothetical protein